MMGRASHVIKFPAERPQRATKSNATYFDILRGRTREWLCRVLNYVGVPGAIQPMDYVDKVTGWHVAVSAGEMFMRLSVNGRDFYFDRLTGRFSGTGEGCDCP